MYNNYVHKSDCYEYLVCMYMISMKADFPCLLAVNDHREMTISLFNLKIHI